MSLTLPPDALVTIFGELTLFIGFDEIVMTGPGRNSGARRIDPDTLREWSRTDALGRYRPLSGARSLRPGWHVRLPTLDALPVALEAIYPLAETHAAAWQSGMLAASSLDEVLARQTGRYEVATELSQRGRAVAARVLCGRCVRVPVWDDEPVQASSPEETMIPCPEPCSVLVSLCREAALWERGLPVAAPVDPTAPFAAFDRPGNEVREHYLAVLRR